MNDRSSKSQRSKQDVELDAARDAAMVELVRTVSAAVIDPTLAFKFDDAAGGVRGAFVVLTPGGPTVVSFAVDVAGLRRLAAMSPDDRADAIRCIVFDLIGRRDDAIAAGGVA